MTFDVSINITQYYEDEDIPTTSSLSFISEDETWHAFLPYFRQALAGAGFIFDTSWELQMVNTDGEEVVPILSREYRE